MLMKDMNLIKITISLMVILSGCTIGQNPESPATQASIKKSEVYEQPADTPGLPESPEYDGINATLIEINIHKMINNIRLEEGLKPLIYDERLAAIGRFHSVDMANHNNYSHWGSDGSSPAQRLLRFNYRCSYSGENLDKVPGPLEVQYSEPSVPLELKLASVIVGDWMNSTDHRQNILNPNYVVEGIGVFINEGGTLYVSQEFCG